MLYLVIFLFVLLIILGFLYFIKVTIKVKYILKGLDDILYVNLSALKGLVSYTIYFPRKKGESKKRPDEIDAEKNKTTIEGIRDKYENMRKLYGIIKKIRVYLLNKLEVQEFKINVEYGTGDAALTGVLGGVIWTLVGALEAFFCSSFKTEKHDAKVVPRFNEAMLKVKVKGIFSIKIVHIIVVAIKYQIHKQKHKRIKGGGVNGKSTSY